MSISQICIYIAVYILPALYMFGLACIVIAQHAKRLENRLIATMLFIYCIVFLGELFRHLLPINYSTSLVEIILGSLGVLTIGVSFHLYMYVADLHKLMKTVYPFLFYIPFICLVIIQLLGLNFFSSVTYNLEGIWHKPVVDETYYITLTIAVLLNVVLLFILVIGNRKVFDRKRKKLLRFLMLYSITTLVMKIGFGYPSYSESFPPYPIIFEGLIFSVFISFSYLHNDLLPNITKHYQTLFDISPISIIIVNENMDIIEINNQGMILIGMQKSSELNLMKFAQTKHNKNQLHKLIYDIQREGIVQDYPITLENIFNDGTLHFSVDAKMVITGEEKNYYAMLRDVTSEVKKEKVILHMAYHDVLTDLHNRAYFVTQLRKKLVEISKSPISESVFVLIDLNNFKSINDSFGHQIGDQVLHHTASILKQSVSENALVARLGGDEFVLFLQDFNSREKISEWLYHLRSTFEKSSFYYNDIEIKIEPSIGISIFPEQGTTFEDLFNQADLNMYIDKENSKSKKLGV
ncbi:GGDEF domain-containing protein [Psychrobacillus antarcticus]|uniref:GGDEF domain-containing protein n=1 Tax=Psychrobacillus antarcticus TaxID=2879115 RepID=UPI00240879D4|nr:GGDEF domain-containing protein [Psychrobacillus antarcticus]